jgi:hypothetical protein
MNDEQAQTDNTEIETSTLDDLAERFEVSIEHIASDGRPPLEIFRDMLAARLRQIIDQQFSRLAPLLYRIDVDERRVDEIMRRAPFSEVPTQLADLIIERRLLAMETRRRYREERRVGEGVSGRGGEEDGENPEIDVS